MGETDVYQLVSKSAWIQPGRAREASPEPQTRTTTVCWSRVRIGPKGPRVLEDLDQNRPITDELSIFCISCWIRPAPRQPVCHKNSVYVVKRKETGVRVSHPFSEKGAETRLVPRNVVCLHRETGRFNRQRGRTV